MAEGYVFTSICLSTGGGWVLLPPGLPPGGGGLPPMGGQTISPHTHTTPGHTITPPPWTHHLPPNPPPPAPPTELCKYTVNRLSVCILLECILVVESNSIQNGRTVLDFWVTNINFFNIIMVCVNIKSCFPYCGRLNSNQPHENNTMVEILLFLS